MDIDDKEAERVTAQLPQWGQSLFDAVFNNVSVKQLFSQFINTPSEKYLLTIAAQTPKILSLPWELLHDAGQFLFTHQPSICQSAIVAHEETDEEPIGSIAVGLVASSVPSVLAMSYSVMVRATELLFGGFYREIAGGKNVGMALENLRTFCKNCRQTRQCPRN